VFNAILSLELALGCSQIGRACDGSDCDQRLTCFCELSKVGSQAHIPPQSQAQVTESGWANLPKLLTKKAVTTLRFIDSVGPLLEPGAA
jgi:hypothetical protein